uniref:Uncharacterized protein n=1 Tax=Arundo donax TaxID=35708 RepID=A0A0A9HD80_ARUDO
MLRMFVEREGKTGNVKLGWYGGAPADVQTAGDAFFRRSNWSLLGGDRAHGRGMHLSPLRFPHLSDWFLIDFGSDWFWIDFGSDWFLINFGSN